MATNGPDKAEAANGQSDSFSRNARKYGPFQSEVYAAGMYHGQRPALTKDPSKLEAQAKEKLGANSYAYVAGGAGERSTMDANRLAFRQWKIVPRMLQPTTHRDMRVNLFGQTYDTPILAAPVGVQTIFHEDGEKGVAEVASAIGVPYITSTASSFSLEDIAEANGSGPRWFQLYWPHTKSITESLLSRAKKAGYTTLIVTLDTWALGWRPWDLDNAYVPFFRGTGNATGFTDPAFRAMYAEQSGGETPESNVVGASMAWIADVFSGAAHSWEELAHVRAHWDGPILLKGIQHADDAVAAVRAGMDGVVVSNHGGRQVDGAVGSLEMLPEIVEALAGLTTERRADGGGAEAPTVLFDSGVRTGVDVIKALCLGAKAVLVGRPWVYGLGINGKAGARDALKGMLADVDQSMGLAGIQNIDQCRPELLRRSMYPGDRHANN